MRGTARHSGTTTRAAIAAGVLLGAAGVAVGNPALAEQLRKSPVSDMAAGATTVADQLAIRRFGVAPGQQPAGRTYTAVGVVPDQRPWWHHRGRDGYYGYNPSWRHGDQGRFDPDDPRLPDGFDLDQYDDRKPHNFGRGNGFRIGIRTGFRTGYSSGFGWGTGAWDPYWGDPYWNNRYWWDFPYGVDGRLVQPGSSLTMPAPTQTQTQQPAPEPETELEAGRRLLWQGVYEASVERYRRHLAENPEDFEVMAELAVALAGANRFDDATAMVRMAYDKDPGLAGHSVSERVSLDSRALRKLVVKAVRSAHDRDSASGWLLVTVLMQAEDRDSVGLRILERATDRGLEPRIADSLRAELR